MAKRGKRERPELPAEYVLLVTPHVDSRTGQEVTLIGLRTVTEFINFRYELVVKPEVSDRTITLLIQGLRAPELTLPAMGPAEFRLQRPDIEGRYEIVVSKHNKQVDSYTVKIARTGVKVEKTPEERFTQIVTRLEDW